MSEKMIERQRAKLGLPPFGTSTLPGVHAAAHMAPIAGNPSQHSLNPLQRERMQREAAVVVMANEDERMQRFLNLLAASSSHPSRENATDQSRPQLGREGPTVPISLSRRILHRQGVGYLDEAVAAIASASADRFLATVLQQAAACRDRRLKGEELARQKEGRERRIHRKRRRKESRARKLRNESIAKRRRDANMTAIEAAENLQTAGSAAFGGPPGVAAGTASGSGTPKGKNKKNNKKGTTGAGGFSQNGMAGLLKDGAKVGDNGSVLGSLPIEDASDDSLDDEDAYYDSYYGSDDGSDLDGGDRNDESDQEDDDDEDETRFTLLLRDIARPLDAWGVTLVGKVGLGAVKTEDAPGKQESGDGEDDNSDVVASGDQTTPQESGDGTAEEKDTENAPLLSGADGSTLTPPTKKGATSKKTPSPSASQGAPSSSNEKNSPDAKRALSTTKAPVSDLPK